MTRAHLASRVIPYIPLAIILFCCTLLGFALASQYLWGLSPCELCMKQRWVLGLAMVPALQAHFASNVRLNRALLSFSGLLILSGSAIAAFHVGVEKHWWEASCTSLFHRHMSIDAMEAALSAHPQTACDALPWQFLGLSMAGWNAIISFFAGLILCTLSVPGALACKKRSTNS